MNSLDSRQCKYLWWLGSLRLDRVEYGSNPLSKLAASLKKSGLKGLGITNLKLFRQFYMLYPQFGQTLSGQFRLKDTLV
jgi:hypothetical protein